MILTKKPNKVVKITDTDIIHYRKTSNKLCETERTPMRRANGNLVDCVSGHVNCLVLQGYEVFNGN